MFKSKQQSLIQQKGSASVSTSTNGFVQASLKQAARTTSLGNGAVKYKTTGNAFVDQFGKATNYKAPRDYSEVEKDMSLLWSIDQKMTIALTFYMRMITRVTKLFNGSSTSTTQRGQGLKHEGIFRMIWLQVNNPAAFWKNIDLYISIGSWKDIITMLSYDLQWNGWDKKVLDWDKFGSLILAGLENPNNNQLLLKYLPQIKSNSKCKTLEAQADNIIAKWICSLVFGGKTEEDSYKNYRNYRKLKASGTAHQWQQLISRGKALDINFDTVHGRALAQLVSGKFLTNQGLEARYNEWIESKPVAKYTGYVYELFKVFGQTHRSNLSTFKKYQIDTINKQFLGLVETGKKGLSETQNPLIVVLDTSGSMTGNTPATGLSAYSIGKSMALYFSYLLTGPFENTFLEFSNETVMKQWTGSTPVDKYCNERSEIVAGTNFLSVADHFGRILQRGVSESEFPGGILCISDGCFNSAGHNTTNFEALKKKLLHYGFSQKYVDNFKVVLWDLPSNYYGKPQTAFEDFAGASNLLHISGLDPAAVAFITGTTSKPGITPTTSEELLEAALDQEIMQMISL